MLNCYKCGRELDVSPYGKGRLAVVHLGSDHASKCGCNYVAENVDKVTKALFPPAPKKEKKAEEKDK